MLWDGGPAAQVGANGQGPRVSAGGKGSPAGGEGPEDICLFPGFAPGGFIPHSINALFQH